MSDFWIITLSFGGATSIALWLWSLAAALRAQVSLRYHMSACVVFGYVFVLMIAFLVLALRMVFE